MTRQPPPPYERKPSLVTKSELKFLTALRSAVGSSYAICCMVRLADLIRVEKGARQWQSWQNRIHAKHIDFVLCDWKTMAPLLAIELDDRSHERPDRIARDQFVNAALESAGLPLLRVPVEKKYFVRELRRQIEAHKR